MFENINEQLKAENEQLKAENEQLKAENDAFLQGYYFSKMALDRLTKMYQEELLRSKQGDISRWKQLKAEICKELGLQS